VLQGGGDKLEQPAGDGWNRPRGQEYGKGKRVERPPDALRKGKVWQKVEIATSLHPRKPWTQGFGLRVRLKTRGTRSGPGDSWFLDKDIWGRTVTLCWATPEARGGTKGEL